MKWQLKCGRWSHFNRTLCPPFSKEILLKQWSVSLFSKRLRRTEFDSPCIHIGIKHGFSCINIRQVPWEVLKTEAEGRGFQHLPKDLANVNALKNHVRSLLLHKNWNICYISRNFWHCFVSPFHRCLANVISTDYAPSRAGEYKSRDGSNSVAPVRAYWKLCSRALTAREWPC